MGSLDANVVLRLIIGDLPQQADQARTLLKEHQPLHVADIVFIEIEYALRVYYELNRQQITQLLSSFCALPTIQCNRRLFTKVLTLYPHHPALSFTDICLSCYAQLNHASPLYTFDRKMIAQLPNTQPL